MTRFFVPAAALILSASLVGAQGGDKPRKIRLSGDLRFRMESDFDGLRADGAPQSDRTRGRLRARLAGTLQARPWLLFAARLRTGSVGSQQSPHVTLFDLNGNPLGDHHVVPDQYYLKLSQGRNWIWAGRNQFPFWRQNEIFWDDDVTPTGVAGAYALPGTGRRLQAIAGIFTLPDGAVRVQGNLKAGQLLWEDSFQSQTMRIKGAAGFYKIDGRAGVRHLRAEFAARDYSLLQTGAEARLDGLPLPLSLGAEWTRNRDARASLIRGQDVGYLLTASLGAADRAGDASLSYFYAKIGRWAVHPSYGQDDWFRWGTATQTDSSDFKGHEWRVVYRWSDRLTVVGRAFSVGALSDAKRAKRLRVDLNYRF
ncbi:MAG TPA: putative porin [Acidobacteriota bacterium]|nr:putative porin [Acidobacteriota bacterium]